MPLCKTGAGKSTTIQLLSGAKMIMKDGHIQADPEDIEIIPLLKKIVSDRSVPSVTRYCQSITIKHGDHVIGILDTPSHRDSQCPEMDMSNSITYERVIKNCKKMIFPIILISFKNVDHMEELRREILEYSYSIKNIVENINGFSYYFT
jgi:ribosome biogenesis GTPase A